MKLGSLKLFEGPRYIGGEENPLLVRWVIFRVPSFGIFLHKLCRSDHDRALHDHPWTFTSLILKNGYSEVTPEGTLLHKAGAILYRPAEWKHRVVIENFKPAWTLVFVARKRRRWGFWPKSGWCWWRKYNPDLGICQEDILWDGDES